MELEGLQVVVVGGAIAGASSALALARAGAQVTLIERLDETRAAGAGIALAENGLAVLEALGLGEAIARASVEIAGVRISDAQGRTLFEPAGRAPGLAPRLRMARRSELYAALADAVASESRIHVQHGTEVLGVEARGVATTRGSIPGELVIGADGVHSRVRFTAGFRARMRRSGIAYARALADEGLARGEEAWTAAGLFGSFPVVAGTYWYASLGTRALRRALLARDLPSLRAAWARAYPASEPLWAALPSFDALLVNDVIEVKCARFVRGNVALVGDAAHAMAPNLGQGANSALVDAAVLCSELRRASSLAAALDAYDRRRRAHVQRVATTAARLGRLAELTHPIARFLRDRVLMPLAARGDGSKATRMTLQEAPDALAQELQQSFV